MRFLSNFVCKIIFMCSVNFWHQQDSNSLFKGSIDHVTSKCNWPVARFSFLFTVHLLVNQREFDIRSGVNYTL